MSADPRRDPPAKISVDPKVADKAKAAKKDRALREQTRTEVEERPYLDTEGGE